MIVAWTGHRPDLFADPVAAQRELGAVAQELVSEEGATHFLVGGQRGVDTWAALAALELGVPFSLMLPLPVSSFVHADWSTADHQRLDQIAAAAAEVVIVAEGDLFGDERERAFSERNRLLASGADLLVAVWTGTRGGGTEETIDLAHAQRKQVREIVLQPSPTAASAQGRGV